MIQYQIQNDFNGDPIAVTIVGQTISIPMNPDNTDYAQFKKAVLDGAELQDAEGNTMSAEQATQFVKELP
jgi:hypothetical protein